MDSKEQLWVGRGEVLGRLFSETQRAPSSPGEHGPAVDPRADPLEAARFSASIALAMRNGALRKGREARAEAMRAAFHGLMRGLRRCFASRSQGTLAPAPVRRGSFNGR